MAHARAATWCPDFDDAIKQASGALRSALQKAGLTKAPVFACLWESSADWVAKARTLLELLEVDPDEGHHLREVLLLYKAAAKVEDHLARQHGLLTGLQVSADLTSHQRAAQEQAEEKAQRTLALTAFAHLPAEWRGKRYRRTEGQATATAREDGERRERLKAAKKVVGLLLEANLPYATALRSTGAEGEASLRCCRGLRAKTLEQRLSYWNPFRR